jgi:hypothetical protein
MAPANDPSARTGRLIGWVLCCLVPPAFGLLALAFGQDANWDLRNYHWYNPYALLHHRWEFDVGLGAYYNPIIDVPMYLAAQHLSARALSFLLGLVQGLNFLLVYALARVLLRPVAEPWRAVAAGIVALVGVTGGGALSLVGTTFNDTVLSFAVLGAALIIVSDLDTLAGGPHVRAFGRVALAGLLVGADIGLKLPVAIFAVGFCVALLTVGGDFKRGLALAFVNGLGVLAGFALSGGAWMWRMWVDYRNPLFPYFNALFRSPMVVPESYRDVRFLPNNILEGLFFPIAMSADPGHVGEIQFRDWRILAVYVVLLATPFVLLARRRARAPSPATSQPLAAFAVTRYLMIAAVVAFAVWVSIFAIYRYLIPLEMLAPLLAVGVIAAWPFALRTRVIVASLMLLVVAAATQPGTWGRSRHGWSKHLLEVTVPPIPDPAHTIVVLVGIEPLSYVAAFLPPEIPVLRLQGYLTDPKDRQTGLNQLLHRRLDSYTGDIYLLVAGWEHQTAVDALKQFGLTTDFARCGDVGSNVKPTDDDGEQIGLCPVTRAGSS